MNTEIQDVLIFVAQCSKEKEKHIGFLCPHCSWIYCSGKYVLTAPLEGTDIALVRLAPQKTTACPHCNIQGLYYPQFVNHCSEANTFPPVSVDDTDTYISGDELNRADIRPDVQDLMLRN